MTNDEMTVLMIAAQGEPMIPIGRWEQPVRDLAARGLMQKQDAINYVITSKGMEALRSEEQQRDGEFANALRARQRRDDAIHVDMTVLGRNIRFDLTYDPNFVSDVHTLQFLQHNGACEPEVVHLMRRVIRPGDFVIDGGANIGFFTMVMSRRVGEQGHVEAFEPSTLNFNKLRANLALNKVENVTAVNRALWSEDAEVTLHQGLDTGISSLMPFAEALNHIPVGGITLDKWCLAYDQAPRFMKLDIEGAELQALQGADRMLSRGIDFISCELNPAAMISFGTSQMDLRDYMAGKGYSTFLMLEDGSRPQMMSRSQPVTIAGNYGNILFSTVEKVHAAWAEVLS
jgi:FkbM family methyltransferase